ncbi:AcrR family transcriptional regulator [Conyzicola nivalis]|uniref:AcrR family transcriptional regulator n=1 Tax=Conyzicola nivalis TaxID=1477021 RepID=A0ABV2QSW0_9MICO
MNADARSAGRPPHTSRAAIRRIAEQLFDERGYRNVSLEAIAREVGIGRSTLFSYFGSKRAILEYDMEAALRRLEQTLSHGEGPAMDVMVRAVADAARYGVVGHSTVVARWRIVESEPDLLAAEASLHKNMIDRLQRYAAARAPASVDRDALGMTAAALYGAANWSAHEWARSENPTMPMDEYVLSRLTSVGAALRPMIGDENDRA